MEQEGSKGLSTGRVTVVIALGIVLAVGAAFWDYIKLYLWFEGEFVKPKQTVEQKDNWIAEENGKLIARMIEELPHIAAQVNGKPIKGEEVKRVLIRLKGQYNLVAKLILPEKRKNITRKALDELIEEELLFQIAEEKKLLPPGEKVEERFMSLRSHFASLEQFEKVLADRGMSEEVFRSEILKGMAIGELVRREVAGKVDVGPDEIKKYYEEHKHELGGVEGLADPESVGGLPLKEVEGKIEKILRKQGIQEELNKLSRKKRKEVEIEILLL